MSYPFNVRVYFLLWDADRKRLLFSREKIGDTMYLKFPGGGLERGEGTRDCAIREGMEELGVDIIPLELLGITENFVPSLFKNGEQILAVYYLAACNDYTAITAASSPVNDDHYEGMIWCQPEVFDQLQLELASDKIMLTKFSAALKARYA